MSGTFSSPAEPFTSYLRANEDLVWAGQPDPTILFSPSDRFAIPFSMVWGGFALFWNVMVWTGGAPFIFKIWGLPFLGVGLYITIGRFYVKAQRKRATYYALTSERALILNFKSQLRWVNLKDVIHDTRSNQRRQSVAVAFRSPSSPIPGGMMAFGDPQIDGMRFTQNSFGNYANLTPTFVFVDVSDSVGLLNALSQSPQAQ